MRVKVGDTWHSVTASQPIMVELTEADKKNITNMFPEANRYAEFDDGSEKFKDRAVRRAWMDAVDEVPELSTVKVQVLHLYAKKCDNTKYIERDGDKIIFNLNLTSKHYPEMNGLRWLRWDQVYVNGMSEKDFKEDFPEVYSVVSHACLTKRLLSVTLNNRQPLIGAVFVLGVNKW